MRFHRDLPCATGAIALALLGGACNAILGIDEVEAARKPVPITLSQSESIDITHGLGCEYQKLYTLENSFYRRFRLADYGATDGFVVKSMTFGVYFAQSNDPSGAQPLVVAIYEDTDPESAELTREQLSSLRESRLMVPDTATPKNVRLDFATPFEAAPGVLVAELRIEKTQGMRVLRLGVNLQGESAPSYQRAPDCQRPEPVRLNTIPDYEQAALVLGVTGEG